MIRHVINIIHEAQVLFYVRQIIYMKLISDIYVTLTDAAAIANISASLLQYYIKTDRAPDYEEIGGRKLFKRKDMEKWTPVYKKAGRPRNE